MFAGYLKAKSGKNIPLKNQHVYLNTKNQVANYTITQTYSNNEKDPIEVVFRFPTPAGASVYSCEAKTDDGTVISCKIKEKEKAKKEYNEAISKGDTAYYAQRETADVLTMAIGNMASNSNVAITLKYVLMLENEEDHKKLRINFPLTIMPRYSPPGTSQSVQSAVNPTKVSEKPFNMTIEGDIVATDGIVSLDSKTHNIKLSNMKETSLHFEINDLKNLDRDIILTLERQRSKSHAFTQEFKQDLQKQIYRYCTAVNVVPDFSKLAPINILDVHYVFVMDRSGSMEGTDMEICKYSAQQFVALLPIGCTFDIYAFDDHFQKFEPKSDANNFNAIKVEASEWIKKIHASGGTNILPVLKDVYKNLKKIEKLGVIVILSDGGVSNTSEVLQTVRENQNVSIFSIGIGSNVSQALIAGLASQSGGHAEFIGSGDKNIIQKVRAQLKKSQDTLRKYQKDYTLEVKTIGGSFRTVPEKLPTLYDQTNNTIFIFSEYEPASVIYTEKLSDGENNVVNLVPEVVSDQTDYSFHRTAGIKLIDHLQETPVQKKGSLIDDLKVDIDPNTEQIIQISTDLNVLSKHTAFIGVEEKKDKVTGQMNLREVPLQHSNKMNNSSFSQDSDYEDNEDSEDDESNYLIAANIGVVKCKSMPLSHISTSTTGYAFDTMSSGYASPYSCSSYGGGRSGNYAAACEEAEEEEEEEEEESEDDMGFSLFGEETPNARKESKPKLSKKEKYEEDYEEDYDEEDDEEEYEEENKLDIKLDIKYVINVCLSGTYTKIDGPSGYSSAIGGIILTAKSNESLLKTILKFRGKIDKNFKFNIGDIIRLVSEKESQLNTLYEIISVGSDSEPWTLSIYNC